MDHNSLVINFDALTNKGNNISLIIAPPAHITPNQMVWLRRLCKPSRSRLLKKAANDGKDLQLALLDYRNTLWSNTIGSPVQRLMGRQTKALVPTTGTLLKPSNCSTERPYPTSATAKNLL